MERVFTKDVGRFKSGDIRNYSIPVWKDIAKSAKEPLAGFSEELGKAAKEFAGEKSSVRRRMSTG